MTARIDPEVVTGSHPIAADMGLYISDAAAGDEKDIRLAGVAAAERHRQAARGALKETHVIHEPAVVTLGVVGADAEAEA